MGTTRAGNISPDSETAFNFDRLMHRIFDATQTNDGTFMSAESNRASNEQEKWSIEGVEKEKKEESENTAALVESIESERETREEAERERIRSIQDDYNHTFTNEELDQLEWSGDRNAIWTIGGRQISRNQLFNATKKARTNWEESEEVQNMSPEERERVQRIWSQLGQISIRDAEGEARYSALVRQLPPDAQAQLNEQMGQEIGSSKSELQNHGRRSLNAIESVEAGSTLFLSPVANIETVDNNTKDVELATGSGVKAGTVLKAEFNPLGLNQQITISNNLPEAALSDLQPTQQRQMAANFDTGSLSL